MTDRDQKARELKWFFAFQGSLIECPRTVPLQPEPPAPDFVFPGAELGIELTEYSLGQGKGGSKARQLETVRQEIARIAQSKYEAANKHAIQVTIFWANHECPTKREKSFLAHEIAKLVALRISAGQRTFRVSWEQFSDPLLLKYVDSLSMYFIGEEGPSCWASSAGFFLPEASPRIQVVLDEKEGKVVEYRNYCKRIWLLIVARSGFLSSQFFPDPLLQNTRLFSSFDRVFLLDEPRNSVHEIKIERRP